MFKLLESQVYTPEDANVVVEDNTDFTIDGDAKLVRWGDRDLETFGKNKFLDITFTSIDFDQWEELVLQIYTRPTLDREDVFKIKIGANEFTLDDQSSRSLYRPIVIRLADAGYSNTVLIRITSLVDQLDMFIDHVIVRKVGHEDQSIDLLEAVKSQISLDFGVQTTLTAPATAGAASISLAAQKYIFDGAQIKIDAGGANEEIVELETREGKIRKSTPLTKAHSSSETVDVLVPVRIDRRSTENNDPMVGIISTGYAGTPKIDRPEIIQDGSLKVERWISELLFTIYVETTAEIPLHRLANQFRHKFGDRFIILLDGELVDIYMSGEPGFVSPDYGGLTRMSFPYEAKPRPVTIARVDKKIVTTIKQESTHATSIQ